jgi:hypothetical protein
MEEKREIPTAEASLRSISWHLKCLVEEVKALKQDLIGIMSKHTGDSPF